MDTQPLVVFIHRGMSWYLSYTLRQALFFCGGKSMALLSDSLHFPSLKVTLLSTLNTKEITRFTSLYEHRSSNRESFEFFCWLRWFYLKRYMKEMELSSVLYLDSDVLLFTTPTRLLDVYEVHDALWGCVISRQDFASYDWAASPHVSYWTREGLESFCDFILESFSAPRYLELYAEKWRHHMETGTLGGICDMTTLYLFWRENEDKVINFAKTRNDHMIDMAISTSLNYEPDEYVMEQNHKKVVFSEGKPTLFRTVAPAAPVKACAIHFQGDSKPLIPEYFQGKKTIRMYLKKIRRRISTLRS